MTMLHSWEWGNPEDVAARREAHEQRQAAACGSCTHHLTLTVNGKTIHACDLRRRYGTRCESFKPQPKGASKL